MEIKARGIDVSRWQGTIDWPKVKESGVDFAMIRLGSGLRNGMDYTLDSLFYFNVNNALAAGVEVGVYFYSYADSPAAAESEACFVARILEEYRGKLAYPVAYDLEDKTQAGLGRETLTAMVEAFGSVIEESGWYFTLYASLDWLKNKLDMAKLACFDVWVAQWASRCAYSGDYGMWQYAVLGNGKEATVSGSVGGITGDVDVNYAYRDYPTIIKSTGLNGYSACEDTPKKGQQGSESAGKEKDLLMERGLSRLVENGLLREDQADGILTRAAQPVTIGELLMAVGRMSRG